MEKTRSSQQTQIQSLQMQVQNFETTVETLGQFMLQLMEKNCDIEESMPSDVQRILQQIGNLNSQRKKPIFIERKIGKSMSMNAQLGFPSKIMEELEGYDSNKNHDSGKPKSAFFENTYNQLRKQSIRNRPSFAEVKTESTSDENIPPTTNDTSKTMNGDLVNGDNILKAAIRNNDGLDSGIATPLSPKENSITSIVETIPSGKNSMTIDQIAIDSHPFGNCEDINFKYSSTQLKSLRPLHLRTTLVATATGSEKHIDGRS